MAAAEKITILLLPGMDGTGELLTPLVDQLSMHRPARVIAYPTDRPLGYDDLVAFVADRVPRTRFVILGESFSGPIAIEIAARWPCVSGLILASSFVRHPVPRFIAPIARIFGPKWIPPGIIAAALLGSTGSDVLKVRLREILETLPSEIIRARISEVLLVDKRNSLRDVKCPILCLYGRLDRLVRKQHLDEIVSMQPQCEVCWFDASHMLLETHAGEAAQAINRFCDQLG